MKKVVIAPDKFKRTLESQRFCQIIKEEIISYYPKCNIIELPLADGGDGTLECFRLLFNCDIKETVVKDLHMKKRTVKYGLFDNDKKAIIEAAQCAGQVLIDGPLDCMNTTTYGIGQLINEVVDLGCKEVLVAFGGTCTNDGGAGIATAIGVKFYDKYGNTFLPVGKNLSNITKIDISNIDKKFEKIKFTVLADSELPMYGHDGAAYISGPQKGASMKDIIILDEGLRNITNLILRDLHQDINPTLSGGASGGAVGGLKAFLNANVVLGIEYILNMINFKELIEDVDLVITGEGKIDKLSLLGKVSVGVSKQCKNNNVPVLALAGEISLNDNELIESGITTSFTINRETSHNVFTPLTSENDLKITFRNILRIMVI